MRKNWKSRNETFLFFFISRTMLIGWGIFVLPMAGREMKRAKLNLARSNWAENQRLKTGHHQAVCARERESLNAREIGFETL